MGMVGVVGAEGQPTDWADVLVVVVRLQVTLEAIWILKGHAALVTGEGAILCVNGGVGAQDGFRLVGLSAHLADML